MQGRYEGWDKVGSTMLVTKQNQTLLLQLIHLVDPRAPKGNNPQRHQSLNQLIQISSVPKDMIWEEEQKPKPKQ